MAEQSKRLQFLETLLANTGTSKRELARILGMSAQNVFVYFNRDDMKLSYAQNIGQKLGYNLVFTLDNEKGNSSGILSNLDAIVGDGELHRLAFLQVAMKLNGISRKALAERLGLNYMGVNRWFMVDDIAISYIFKIAELYDLKLSVKAEKVKTEPDMISLS